MFSAELKQQTQHEHAALEKKLVGHIKKITSVEDYVELLELMYGFYYPLQKTLEPFLAEQQAGEHYRGRQAGNIMDDINYFDSDQEHAPTLCVDLPFIGSYPEALGALYVVEGSTLGGKIITSMISRQLAIDAGGGFSFFNAYGDQTKAMWDNFKLLLDEPRPDEEKQKIITSARNTFSTFRKWIIQYESAAHQ